MKRFLKITIFFFFLAATSTFAGIFVAEKKMAWEAKKISLSQNLTEKKEIASEGENIIKSIDVDVEKEIGKEIDQKDESTPEEFPFSKNTPVENKFSFAILGDTQYFKPGTSGGYQLAVGNIKKFNPNLVFGTGDMISSCDEERECEGKYSSWKSVLGSLGSKAYVMQGNHDRTGKDKSDNVWEKVFSYLPGNGPQGFVKFVYSFDFENSHFAVLDSDKPKEFLINDTQRNWLEQDLSKTSKENIFVFFHEPAYPTNSKIGEALDTNPKDRDVLWNILLKHKVKAVFSGHEHIQSRRKVNGLYQFVFGNTDSFNHLAPKPGMAEYSYVGQGFGMVEIVGQAVTVKTYSVQGKLLDTFILPR